MRLIGRIEIWTIRFSKPLENLLLRISRIILNSQELCDLDEVLRIVAWVFVFPCPLGGDGRAEWKCRETCASAEKRKAALVANSLEQDRPSLLFERSRHLGPPLKHYWFCSLYRHSSV